MDLIGTMTERMHLLAGTCEEHGALDAWLPKAITVWTCPACADAAHKLVMAQQMYDERVADIKRWATVPPKFAGQRFVHTTNEQKAARLSAKSFADQAKAGTDWCSLTLSGEAGTGKTLMATEIIERYIESTLKSARYVTGAVMVSEIYTAYRDDNKTELGEITKFAGYGLLVIDEIDLIKPNDSSQGLLTEVINARYNNNRPVIVITNKPRADLGKYVGARVDDRLYENGYLSLFTWPSFRRAIN